MDSERFLFLIYICIYICGICGRWKVTDLPKRQICKEVVNVTTTHINTVPVDRVCRNFPGDVTSHKFYQQ